MCVNVPVVTLEMVLALLVPSQVPAAKAIPKVVFVSVEQPAKTVAPPLKAVVKATVVATVFVPAQCDAPVPVVRLNEL